MPVSLADLDSLIEEYAEPTTEAYAGLGRQFTDDEWDELTSQNAYPNLDRTRVWRTRLAPAGSASHNCVGWSIGRTDVFEFDNDPGVMLRWYLTKGYQQVPTGDVSATVDLWVQQNGTFSHAAKKYTGPRLTGMPADLWESFPYPAETFTHGRYDIRNAVFFSVKYSLRPKP